MSIDISHTEDRSRYVLRSENGQVLRIDSWVTEEALLAVISRRKMAIETAATEPPPPPKVEARKPTTVLVSATGPAFTPQPALVPAKATTKIPIEDNEWVEDATPVPVRKSTKKDK